ncbi:MAG: hypothetical protein BKPUNTRY_003032, partial [Candidatus Fervidibacter sp.]
VGALSSSATVSAIVALCRSSLQKTPDANG